MKASPRKSPRKSARKRQQVTFKVKLSPKKIPKKVFNPFGLDLSTNVEKILGLDSQVNKGYKPGRKYAQIGAVKNIYSNAEVLGYLEKEAIDTKNKNSHKGIRQIRKAVVQTEHQIKYTQKYTSRHIFKKVPLRRHETDMLMFKDVFVAPRQKKLQKLSRKKGLGDSGDESKQEIDPQLKELLKEERNPNEIKIKKRKKKKVSESTSGITLLSKESMLQKSPGTGSRKGQKHGQQDVTQSQQFNMGDGAKKQKNFFESQILVQPTEMPNATIASPLTPGNGWAPSLPLLNLKNTNKESVKDLLIRANAGMQAGDIQKEAHLTFYLGVIHEANRNYKQAIKFHKKFYSCAKLMEDKVGMALAMNRIGINLFNCGQKKRSIEYHLKNIEFTDQENAFAGFYNLGISYRSIGEYGNAISFFDKALAWATDRKVNLFDFPIQLFQEVESECLSYGQLGMTHLKQAHYQLALKYFSV